MDQTAKNPKRRGRPKGRLKNQKVSRKPGRLYTAGAPLLRLHAHSFGIVNMLGSTMQQQINVAPTLANFPQALQMAAKFQFYRIPRISYSILPLVNMSQAKGLVTCLQVSAFGGQFPSVSTGSYIDYNKVNVFLVDKQKKFSFVPYARTSDDAAENSILIRAPKIPAAQTLQPHYGHSCLFVKNQTQDKVLRFVITAEIQFYGYDGGNAVLRKTFTKQQLFAQFQSMKDNSFLTYPTKVVELQEPQQGSSSQQLISQKEQSKQQIRDQEEDLRSQGFQSLDDPLNLLIKRLQKLQITSKASRKEAKRQSSSKQPLLSKQQVQAILNMQGIEPNPGPFLETLRFHDPNFHGSEREFGSGNSRGNSGLFNCLLSSSYEFYVRSICEFLSEFTCAGSGNSRRQSSLFNCQCNRNSLMLAFYLTRSQP